jgi:Tol biopolymer transport system component
MNRSAKSLGWLCTLALCGSVCAAAGPFELVSVPRLANSPPAGGNGDSFSAALTPDGRYLLFASTANNLVLNPNTNPAPGSILQKWNVFLRDRVTGSTTLVSVNYSGTGPGNGDSLPTGVSTNGRYALFESAASDLVAGDTNGVVDVFVRDLWSNVTFVVSASTNGAVGNGTCRGSTLTPDGHYAAFVSSASNLAPDTTNDIPNVFVRDLRGGATTLASVGALARSANTLVGSESPDISDDGRYVAFYSTATNLAPGVTKGGEIYVRDLVAGTAIHASAGAPAFLGALIAYCFDHVLSSDGVFLAYEACTSSPPAAASAPGTVLRFSLDTGLTDLVSTDAYVPTANPEEIHNLAMTPDGRFIVFVVSADASGTTCIELWDAQSGVSTLISGDQNGNVPTNSLCAWPVLDSAGRYVSFLSNAGNLVTNVVPDGYHLYVRDVQAGVTILADADAGEAGSPLGPATTPRLSANVQLVAFERPDAVPRTGGRYQQYNVFARDMATNASELISPHDPTLLSPTAEGSSSLSTFSASLDGRFVAFASEADDLVSNDTNGFRDVFVRDRLLGTNILVSVGTNGTAADGISSEPAIGADGRYVAFSSTAENLVNSDANSAQDIFLRDLQTGVTTLISVKVTGSGSGNAPSHSPSVSADGRFVLFRSLATDLAVGATQTYDKVFLRDTLVGVTYAISADYPGGASMTPDGRFIAFAASPPTGVYIWDSRLATRARAFATYAYGIANVSISPDGSKIAAFDSTSLKLFDRSSGRVTTVPALYAASRPGLRFSHDGSVLTYAAYPTNAIPSPTNQVYLYDFAKGTNLLVSSAFGGSGGANANSDLPAISADGRFVAYRSFASNILPLPGPNKVPELFLYDRLAGSTTLLTASRVSGAPANNRSLTPVFSGDGRTLFFESWASDLVAQDLNWASDVFALGFLYVSVSTPPGSGPTLTWPARPGETYQVLFKNDPSDAAWQTVTGTITIQGDQAQVTDLAPAVGQRFYRVVAF